MFFISQTGYGLGTSKEKRQQWQTQLQNGLGSQIKLILQLVQEQQRRNIIRPWFVDSGCSMYMRGDISNLLVIQIINDRYVSLAGREKGKITQMGTVRNGVLKKVTSIWN